MSYRSIVMYPPCTEYEVECSENKPHPIIKQKKKKEDIREWNELHHTNINYLSYFAFPNPSLPNHTVIEITNARGYGSVDVLSTLENLSDILQLCPIDGLMISLEVLSPSILRCSRVEESDNITGASTILSTLLFRWWMAWVTIDRFLPVTKRENYF